MDYSSLVPAGQSLSTLTLGLGSDDFQFPDIGNPFSASINGVADPSLTTELNSLNETGPVEHYFSIGIGPSLLLPSNVLTLSINEGGTGGDGWAMDFLTIGVTTSVPEPGSLTVLGMALGILLRRRPRVPLQRPTMLFRVFPEPIQVMHGAGESVARPTIPV